MNIKAVIYDCDGVLFDSKEANKAFYNHILRHFGRAEMTPEEISYCHTHTAEETIRYLFRGDPNCDSAINYRLQVDYSPFLDFMIIEPHLVEILEYLRPRYKTAVSTNRSTTIKMVLEKKGIAHLFDMIVSALDVISPKPHPEGIQKILKAFGIGPEEAIFVGDSDVDLVTARRGGVWFVAYKNPVLEADFHINDHLELKEVLSINTFYRP
jgi:HAD superfamily hydrolase (TIGR01549 family)